MNQRDIHIRNQEGIHAKDQGADLKVLQGVIQDKIKLKNRCNKNITGKDYLLTIFYILETQIILYNPIRNNNCS